MSEKRLLYVFAHPDDETFTSGVTIAKYAREEKTLQTLLCATRGQAGRAGDPPVCEIEQLPQVREQELRTAVNILGIDSLELLDYEDKKLNEIPVHLLTQKIQQTISRVNPQVVVTFAPHGISGHPDHQAISRATKEAVIGQPSVRKLYFCTLPNSSSIPAGRTIFTDPVEKITTEIEAPQYVPLVANALLAHRSQHLSVESVFPGISTGDYRFVRPINYFILAWHNLDGYQPTERENDLFAGIN